MNTQLKPNARDRRVASIAWRKLAVWLGIAVVVLLGARLAPDTASASVAQSTVPPQPELLTILVGPIDSTSDTQWVVAGITVNIDGGNGTIPPINQRQEPVNEDNWARVEGIPDGAGGLDAERIKVLPQQPFVLLEGPLQALEDAAITVSGIDLGRTTTTLIVGDLAVGDRVKVAAAVQTDGSLLALQVSSATAPPDDDDDNEDDTSPIELKGVVVDRPENGNIGQWNISGIMVTVNDQTEVRYHVSDLIPGAWVKVEGTADGSGGIVAGEFRATESRRYHKLEGILDSLNDQEVVVSGITLKLAENVKLEDDPTVGQPVEVKANYNEDEDMLYAFLIEGEQEDDDDYDHHDTRHFVGTIKQLPADGMFGEWQVGRKTIVVTPSTVIHEHKGFVEEGARVRVEILKKRDRHDGGPYTAVKVVVLRGAHHDHHDDDDDDHNRYVEFKGYIRDLPDEGLRGEWLVDETTVIVTEKTRLKGDRDEFAVDEGGS
ncbi:MAG: DUF5666 domain-containing protein [Caldilineaceae bacterium]